MHTEGRARELGALGGKRRSFDFSKLRKFDDPVDAGTLKQVLGRTLNEVRGGRMDPRASGTVASLATIFLRAVEIFDIERRLRAIEERDAQREKGGV